MFMFGKTRTLSFGAINFLLIFTSAAVAASDSADAIATVNGQAVSKSLYERVLKASVGPNQPLTPDLEKLVKEDLVNRLLLSQEAQKLGLDKTPEAQAQWAVLQENYMIELLNKHLLEDQPISDAELHTEYDRQIALLSKGEAGQQYNVRLMILSTDTEAREVISSLRKGAGFEKLAHEKSLDPSKEQGGNLGWVLPSQLNPQIANVMVNLTKGAVTVAPIQTGSGWVVMKVEDIRQFKAPAFSESRNQLITALLQARRAEYLKKVRNTADIK